MNRSIIESGAAFFTLPGQTESGDRHAVVEVKGGAVATVVDGLGHGSEAAAAAELAIKSVQQHADGEPLTALLKHCHSALKGSRGAVMNVAAFDAGEGTLTWLGIGNVEGRLLLKSAHNGYVRQNLLLRPGVVGQRLPSLQAAVTRVQPGDMVIFATDGIAPDFAEQVRMDAPVDEIAERIITRYCKKTDDALVLVVRYLG
jgi:hypothetical protein